MLKVILDSNAQFEFSIWVRSLPLKLQNLLLNRVEKDPEEGELLPGIELPVKSGCVGFLFNAFSKSKNDMTDFDSVLVCKHSDILLLVSKQDDDLFGAIINIYGN
jgi:hypothetical protein